MRFSRALFVILLVLVTTASATPPNVIVILTDDQGWGDLSLHGNQNLSTPNIDQLARDGASFDRFFVCPVCSPTRAEFLTGRYHPRSGVFSTSAGGERMNADEKTIAQTFKAAGYRTAAFGKWHNGMQWPYHPNARGFDEFYGFCSGHWGNYFSPLLERNGQIVRGRGFVIDDFTEQAMEFIERHRDQPFFVYLPYNTPHSPMQVPDRWWERFKDKQLSMYHREPKRENVPHTRAALAMCENIDWNVGRLLQRLDELQLTKDTIIVYFADNGPNGFRWNGGMKGRKGSTDEGGVRSPLIVRWPNKITSERHVTQIAAAIDLLPTLAELADIEIASHEPLDGRSLVPLLRDRHADWPERVIMSHWNGRVSARNQHFRMDHQGKLFDMRVDPGQTTNVSAAHAQVAEQLAAAVQEFKQNVLADYKKSHPFVIGYHGANSTQIPARDGREHGNIKRSNRFPNCSYFHSWTSVDDEITWPAQVAQSGDYQVELYYACPANDVGSTIELSFGDSQLTAKITEAHDPPQRGAEHDRVKRKESYVKDFRAMNLGSIHLEKGTDVLRLRATEIPGKQVMEFRLLMFHRQ